MKWRGRSQAKQVRGTLLARGRTCGQCEQRRLKELRWSPPSCRTMATEQWFVGAAPRGLWGNAAPGRLGIWGTALRRLRGRLLLADLGTHPRRSPRTVFRDSCPEASTSTPPPERLAPGPRPTPPSPAIGHHVQPHHRSSSATCLRRQMISRATCSTGDARRVLRFYHG